MANNTKPRHWDMYAYKYADINGGRVLYMHIGSKDWVEIHMLPNPIVKVDVNEDVDGDYYGWLRAGKNSPTMIWPSLAQFTMCFPYGLEVEITKGEGEILRLSVELAIGD